MLKRAHKSIGPLDVDFDATLQAFTGEAAIYCDGISDQVARQYAVSFTLMLENRAREIAVEEPRNPGMFEPNRNLVRLALKNIYERHFGTSSRRNLKADIHALPASVDVLIAIAILLPFFAVYLALTVLRFGYFAAIQFVHR